MSQISSYALPPGKLHPGGTKAYEAIVDAAGNADFVSIAAAFSAGNSRVFVRKGIYIETSDIIVPDDGLLAGESPGSVSIDLSSGAKIKVDGSGRKNTTGTIAATNGSATVTGTGTTFTLLQPGDWISLNGPFHQILSIETDLSLTLANNYQGKTLSGVAMLGQSMLTGAGLCNLLILGATTEAMLLQQVLNVVVKDCLVDTSGNTGLGSVKVLDSSAVMLIAVVVQNAVDRGIQIVGCRGVQLQTCGVRNAVGRGISIEDSRIVILDSCVALHNDSDGFYEDGTCSEISFSDCQAIQNNGHGYTNVSGASSTEFGSCLGCNNIGEGFNIGGAGTVLSSSIAKNNSGSGVVVASTSSNTLVSSCQLAGNTQNGIDASAAATVSIIGCVPRSNALDGIRLGNESIASGNYVRYNSGSGIVVPASKADIIISSNRVGNSGGDGVQINTGAARVLVTSCHLQGNAGTNLLDNGTGTITSANLV